MFPQVNLDFWETARYSFQPPRPRIGSCVYMIHCLKTNKRYIGSAVNGSARWHSHVSDVKNNKHHSIYLQRSYNKYGADVFEFIIIETGLPDLAERLKREQFWINFYRTVGGKGFNIQPIAGSPTGQKISAKTKRFRSLSCFTRKLTETNVRSIFKLLQDGVRAKKIAEQFGVETCTIASIKSGFTWKRLRPKNFQPVWGGAGERNPSCKLSLNQVREIRGLFGITSHAAIAKKFNVSLSTVEAIKYGRTWKGVR